MILTPSILHGVLGLAIMGILVVTIFPQVFAQEQTTLQIIIQKDASLQKTEPFFPKELPFSVGDKIEWLNQDNTAHSISSGMAEHPDYFGYFFSTGIINPGESASIVITSDENYAYYYLCEIHPWMSGKLFLSNSFEATPETPDPLHTDKTKYTEDDLIIASGQVHQDFWGTDYELLLYDQNNKLLQIDSGKFDENSNYFKSIKPDSKLVKGSYQLKLVYGLPSKVAITNFEIVTNNQISIPVWIKDVSSFWCNNRINDAEFIGVMQFLITNNIIKVEQHGPSQQSGNVIPEWIKNNSCWWADNKISDDDFMSGIEFLINQGTIKL